MPAIEITNSEKLWMFALLAVWAGMLFGGFVFGKENADHTHRIPTPMRMGSSLALVVAAWSWRLVAGGSDLSELTLFIAVGMTLGLLGDLFMAGLIVKGDNRVLAGIGAFGLGHVAYITGLVRFGNRFGFDDPAKRWGALAVWLVIGAALWYLVVYRSAEKPEIVHMAALPYALLLASTAAVATGLALQTSAFTLLALGAGLFLASDLLLAAQLFNGAHFRLIGDVVWLMYGPGQMLIVYALALRAMV